MFIGPHKETYLELKQRLEHLEKEADRTENPKRRSEKLSLVRHLQIKLQKLERPH